MSSPASLPNSMPAPKYATPRSPGLSTYGPAVDAVMGALGIPPLPWQSLVNAVAGEVSPDGTWRYPTVILTVPRQAGKTALLGGQLVHRLLTFDGLRAYYTAQNGLAAVDAYSEWVGVLKSRMPDRFVTRASQGRQAIFFEPRNSSVRIFSPTPDALHGRQSDLVVLDECWSHDEDRGDAILQAIVPTQATRKMRQTWLVSTAGDETSDWWRKWVDKGRASLDNPDSGIAYFEWAAPEDTDPADRDSWPLFHPAYGLTQTHDSFEIALEQLGPTQFRRAYLNLWPESATSWRQAWFTCDTGHRIPTDAPVVFGIDSCPRHSKAAIVAAAHLDDGRAAIELVDYRDGIDWVVPRIVELAQRHGATVALTRTGPLGFLIPDLEAHALRLQVISTAGYGDAVSRYQTNVVAGHISHPSDPQLDAAVANTQDATAERPTWRRRDHRVDISASVAAALAVHALDAGPPLPQVF